MVARGLLFWLFQGGFKVSSGTSAVMVHNYKALYVVIKLYVCYYCYCTDFENL